MKDLPKSTAFAFAFAAVAALAGGCAEMPAADSQREYRGEYATGSHLRRSNLGNARVMGREELERVEAMRPDVLEPRPGIGPQQ